MATEQSRLPPLGAGWTQSPTCRIACQDEKNVMAAIAKGDLETTKGIAFALASTEPPTVTDAKGNIHQLPMPNINIHHRLARTRL